MTWFTAITSAPRKQPTLLSTVRSLIQAGFDPLVFAEPGTNIEGTNAITHKDRLGVWGNWQFAANYALDSSDAEHILICQDDVDVHPETRECLEYQFSHIKRGVLSVYTPKGYSHMNNSVLYARRHPGFYPITSEELWGTVGFAYRRADLKAIIAHPLINRWRGVKETVVLADVVNSDVAIGRICKSLNLSVWFPTPSLGVHTSTYSTIRGHGGNDVKCNRNADHPASPREPLPNPLLRRSEAVEQQETEHVDRAEPL